MADPAKIVEIAEANLGKTGCDTNSAGGKGYYTSCLQPWCADFAKWVWAQAGADVAGLTPEAGSFATYSGGLGSTPHVGDAVVFGYDGQGYAEHVAIVVEVSGGTICSIGGDEGYPEVTLETAFVQKDGPYSAAVGATQTGQPISGYVSPKDGLVVSAGRTVGSSAQVAPVVTWAENSLHAFAVAANDSVEYRAWDGQAWTGWVDLGGTVSTTYPTSAPVAWGVNHLDVFFVGTDSNLYHQGWGGAHWNAGWDNLGNSGEPPGSAPVAVSQAENSLDVFVMGPHHQTIWRRSWRGSWSGWSSLGQIVSAPGSTPAVCTWGQGRLDVCVVGANKTVMHSGWDGGAWSGGWEEIGGNPAYDPALVSWGPERLDVFIVGADGNLYHNSWNGNWLGWQNMGNPGEQPRSAPVAVCQDVNRLDVFVMGPHHQTIWRRSWDGGSWSGWESLGQIVSSPDATPAVAAWGPGRLDAFVACAPNSVHHSGWGGGNWSGSWENLAGNVKSF
jgi:hypothetical protein